MTETEREIQRLKGDVSVLTHFLTIALCAMAGDDDRSYRTVRRLIAERRIVVPDDDWGEGVNRCLERIAKTLPDQPPSNS